LNTTSASYALSASNATNAVTASFANAFTVANTLTAQTLVVQTITSSVDFVTGSTRFGSSLSTSTHQFTGSVSITGSLDVITNGTEFQVTSTGVKFGNVIGDAHNITGSVGISGSLSGTSATFSSSVTAGSLIVNQASTAADIILKFQINSTNKWLVGLTNDVVDDNFTIYQDGAGGGNRFTINTSGNVGIGVTTPSYPLHIGSNYTNAGSISSGGDLYGTAYFGQSGLIVGTQSTTSNIALITYGTNKDILFGSWNGSSNSEKMRITGGGNVGIGTSSPTGLGGRAFVVSAVSTYPEIIWERTGDGARKWGTLIGSDGSLLCRDYTSGNNVFNINPGAPNGSLTISGAGWIYIPSITDGAGSYALKWRSGGLLSFDTSSARYKDNIRDSSYGLSDIMKLRSAMFEYKKDVRTDIGLIAEEVYEVIPELVTLNDEGLPNAVAYDRFVSVLTKAIQELKAENDTLKEILQRNNIQ
jgi:hypothetical protein